MTPFVLGSIVRSAWRRRTLLILVASLLAIELVVRMPGFWTLLPVSSAGRPEVIVETALRDSTDIQIVIMGSSRFQTDVSPTILAETLNLPPDQVVNLSFTAGSPMDFAAVYRQHRQILGKAQILIVGTDAFQFNWWMYTEGWLQNRFRQRAPLSWRISVPGWHDRMDLVAGWFWRTWDARAILNGYAHALLAGQFDQRKPSKDELGRIMFGKQTATRPSDEEARERPFKIDFRDYRFAEVQLQALGDLVALATDDGVQVLLVEAPQSPLTLEQIALRFSAEDALWRQRVEAATGLPVEQVPFGDKRCVNWKDCFVDYGHLNAVGTAAYSEAMGAWLLSRSSMNMESLPR